MRAKPAVFLGVDSTLTGTKSRQPSKQHPHDIEVMPGVKDALSFHKKQGYRLIGVSNQKGVPQYKSMDATIAEMHYTLSLLPDLELIVFAPGFSGDDCCIVSQPLDWNAGTEGKVIFVTRQDNQQSFYKPGYGMLEVIEKIDLNLSWMIGDRSEDEGCAAAAGVNFMWAADWRSHFLGNAPEPEGLERIHFLQVSATPF